MHITETEFKNVKSFFTKSVVKTQICKDAGMFAAPLNYALRKGRMTKRMYARLLPVIEKYGFKS